MIAVVGESLFDAHIDGDGFPLFPGGGPFNTSVALARLGIRVCYLGAVSRDRLGERLMAALVSAGVETSRTARVDAPTPLAIVEAGVEPSYSFYLAGTAHEALGRQEAAAILRRFVDSLPLPPRVAANLAGTPTASTHAGRGAARSDKPHTRRPSEHRPKRPQARAELRAAPTPLKRQMIARPSLRPWAERTYDRMLTRRLRTARAGQPRARPSSGSVAAADPRSTGTRR